MEERCQGGRLLAQQLAAQLAGGAVAEGEVTDKMYHLKLPLARFQLSEALRTAPMHDTWPRVWI